MLPSIRKLCRLCSEENSPIDIFSKNENDCDIAELIRKHLHLNVSPLDVAPVSICTICYEFLLSIERFAERAMKVDKMYSTIVFDQMNSIHLSIIKYQFGLVEEESSPSPVTHVVRCDQSTDTFDLNIEFPSSPKYISDVPNINENTSGVVNDKFDSLVQQLFSSNQMDSKTNEVLEANSVTCIKDTESSDLENDTAMHDHDANEEEIESRISPKKRGPKRKGPPYRCTECNQEFVKRSSLHYHKKSAHSKEEFSCNQCDKKFPTRQRAEQHAIVHLDPDHKPKRSFICETCGKSFARNGALKEHTYTHKEDAVFECSKCDKKFKTLQRLKQHEDSHTDTQYICPDCGLTLNTKKTLQMHMVVHSSEKQYKCTVCSSEFKRAKSLKNHLILHTGLRPYTCPFCDKTFTNGSNCRNHKKKAHPIELAAMEAAGETWPATNLPKFENLRAS